MSQLSSRELQLLAIVAAEAYEAVDGEAFTVDVALSQNPSFRASRESGNSLERSILKPAIRRGASNAGLGVDPVGSGIELVSIDTGGRPVRRLYRLRRVERAREDQQLRVVCSRDSTLLRTDPDELWNVERWLFGYRFSDDHTLAELLVAEILGFEDKGVGPLRVLLGNPYPLSPNPVPGGFVSTDESLFPEEDEDGQDEHGEVAAG